MSDVGVYLHVPFCERVCPYCDFAVVATELSAADEAEYVDALLAELDRRREAFGARELTSLYFGGGTPSLLHPEALGRVVRAVREAFSPVVEVETTRAYREKLPGVVEDVIELVTLAWI